MLQCFAGTRLRRAAALFRQVAIGAVLALAATDEDRRGLATPGPDDGAVADATGPWRKPLLPKQGRRTAVLDADRLEAAPRPRAAGEEVSPHSLVRSETVAAEITAHRVTVLSAITRRPPASNAPQGGGAVSPPTSQSRSYLRWGGCHGPVIGGPSLHGRF